MTFELNYNYFDKINKLASTLLIYRKDAIENINLGRTKDFQQDRTTKSLSKSCLSLAAS